jgi:hypothetical protein
MHQTRLSDALLLLPFFHLRLCILSFGFYILAPLVIITTVFGSRKEIGRRYLLAIILIEYKNQSRSEDLDPVSSNDINITNISFIRLRLQILTVYPYHQNVDEDRLLLLTSSGRDSPRTISNILSSLSMSILLAKLPFFLDLVGIVSERVGLLINFMLNFTTDRE